MKIFLSLIAVGSSVLLIASPLIAQTQTGKASFYSDAFEGKQTANGEKYRGSKLTAAHKTLPFGTVVKVTNLANHEEVDVTINDRGPYAAGRIIDLSKAAAEKLKFITQGTAEVKIEIIDGEEKKEKSQPVIADEGTAEGKEFYDFETSKTMPKGFGVQVGAYQELVNLFRITDKLKKSYKKKVVVQVKIIGGAKYYSLILGSFSSRVKAENFANGLKKQFPDVFVLDYSKP